MKKIKLKENVALAKKTTFKVGGAARYYCEVKNEKELVEAINLAKDKSLPIFILGGGSNVVIGDKGFEGLVIKYIGQSIRKLSESVKSVSLEIQAGQLWDDFVKYAVNNNLFGVECMSGIPGTVGAAPIQNIGAYGQEIEQVFIRLRAFDLKKGKFVIFNKKDCHFAYRDSIFKKNKYKDRFVIVSVVLVLKKDGEINIAYNSLKNFLKKQKNNSPDLKKVRRAVLNLRKIRLEDPKSVYNAGSFFKNPIVDTKIFKLLKVKNPQMPFFELKGGKYKIFAGWLIDKAGWKGKKYRQAAVSRKNALIITNPKSKASAEDIEKLRDMIIEDINIKFGVRLEPEVQIVGE